MYVARDVVVVIMESTDKTVIHCFKTAPVSINVHIMYKQKPTAIAGRDDSTCTKAVVMTARHRLTEI